MSDRCLDQKCIITQCLRSLLHSNRSNIRLRHRIVVAVVEVVVREYPTIDRRDSCSLCATYLVVRHFALPACQPSLSLCHLEDQPPRLLCSPRYYKDLDSFENVLECLFSKVSFLVGAHHQYVQCDGTKDSSAVC